MCIRDSYYLGPESPVYLHIFILILLFPIAWICSSIAARIESDPDPNIVVVDEIFGQMLTFLLVFSITPFTLAVGLALFRFFDILKPFPVRQAERLRGGLGVVMDDVVAGLYAGLFTLLIRLAVYGS